MPCGMNLCCSATGWCGVSLHHQPVHYAQLTNSTLRPPQPFATTQIPYTRPSPAKPVTEAATSSHPPHAQREVAAQTDEQSDTINLGTSAPANVTLRHPSSSTPKATPISSTLSPSSTPSLSSWLLLTTTMSSRCASSPTCPRVASLRLGLPLVVTI
jgi:hypothetical protein